VVALLSGDADFAERINSHFIPTSRHPPSRFSSVIHSRVAIFPLLRFRSTAPSVSRNNNPTQSSQILLSLRITPYQETSCIRANRCAVPSDTERSIRWPRRSILEQAPTDIPSRLSAPVKTANFERRSYHLFKMQPPQVPGGPQPPQPQQQQQSQQQQSLPTQQSQQAQQSSQQSFSMSQPSSQTTTAYRQFADLPSKQTNEPDMGIYSVGSLVLLCAPFPMRPLLTPCA
jgi:hypothetical protein